MEEEKKMTVADLKTQLSKMFDDKGTYQDRLGEYYRGKMYIEEHAMSRLDYNECVRYLIDLLQI